MQEIHLEVLPISPSKPASYDYRKGEVAIIFSHAIPFSMPMGPRRIPFPPFGNYLFFELQKELAFNLESETESHVIILHTPLENLHEILSDGQTEVNLPVEAMRLHETYHKFGSNTGLITDVIASIIENASNRLILEAKKFELINYYFNQKEDKVYNCPFLNQQENVDKVRLAKKELTQNLQDSPTIKDLAKSVGMNEHNLKSGFKEIYGRPIYSYLKNHKMTVAKQFLLDKQLSINEVAHEVGYSNVSHFIEAFKKKYGETPKQFALAN